jgi:hypothetical protein
MMGRTSNQFVIATVLVAAVWVVTACGPLPTAGPSATSTAASAQTAQHSSATTVAPAAVAEQRDPDVLALPFPDKPDPLQCGIPEVWNSDQPAWLNGSYQGRLIEPTVFLYESHVRTHITGRAPSGREVRIKLSQANPVLNFYMIRTVGLNPPQEGWVPAPFVQFEPVRQP